MSPMRHMSPMSPMSMNAFIPMSLRNPTRKCPPMSPACPMSTVNPGSPRSVKGDAQRTSTIVHM
eukprot:391722-Pyramimonas_sp.AAC.1